MSNHDLIRADRRRRCTGLLFGVVAAMGMQAGNATPQFAKETAKPCAACHTEPKGGAKLTPLGAEFKANGNKMPASSGTTAKPAEKSPQDVAGHAN